MDIKNKLSTRRHREHGDSLLCGTKFPLCGLCKFLSCTGGHGENTAFCRGAGLCVLRVSVFQNSVFYIREFGKTGLGFRKTTLGSGKTTLGFRKTELGFRKTMLGFRKTMLDFGKTMLGFRKIMLGSGKTMLDFRKTMPGSGKTMLDFRKTGLGLGESVDSRQMRRLLPYPGMEMCGVPAGYPPVRANTQVRPYY
ncbi:MAG: hypothetical protein LBL42_00420 [Tannerella sp.]|jgi:hypothetical protein|nr:hypothetical protein [Tannerella sp.]